MGLYDREYGREFGEETPWDRHQRSQQPKSITIILLVITFAFFLVDMFLPRTDLNPRTVEPGAAQTAQADSTTAEEPATAKKEPEKLSFMGRYLSVQRDTLIKPWKWWQLLTYGFVHDSNGIGHILFNMIGLFVFGRVIEQLIGRHEFLRFYLLSIIFSGIVGAAGYLITGQNGILVGASGGVLAVTILFACKLPQQELLLFFVLPVKAWILAVAYVAMNVLGALGLTGNAIPGEASTAFTVHLAGVAFALLYFYQRWNFEWLDLGFITDAPNRFRQHSRRMKLKIHDPDKKMQQDENDADRILAKIEAEGEESLTPAERKTLQRYSRRLRKQREST